MAQSAPKERAILGFEPFWERLTMKPPLQCKKWGNILELAILAIEEIPVDILREAPTDKVAFFPEPIFEEHVDNSTAQAERDLKIRNEQLKNKWLNRGREIEAAGILCGDRFMSFCDSAAVSLTYLSPGTESRRIFGSQEPTVQIVQITTKYLWYTLDKVSTKQRNIALDRYAFLTRKQLKSAPVKNFY